MRLMESAVAVLDGQVSVEELYRADAERLWRAIYAFAGDTDLASDAVAEAYAQLIRRGADVRNAQAWTWRAAFRICRGLLQSARRNIVIASGDGPTKSDRYADPDLAAALAQLPDGQRAAVVLFYYADLQVSDIARRLGTNSIAVRANLSRGRKRLRLLLGDQSE